MPIVARITENHEFLIKGQKIEGQQNISLGENGDLKVRNIYTTLDAVNDSTEVDEDNQLDDTHEINEDDSIESFLSWFFGVGIEEVVPNRVQFDNGKNIIANGVIENQELGGE